MYFKPKSLYCNRPQGTYQVKINDYEIEGVEQTKFLGVTIDNKLSWLPRLTALVKN